MSIEGLDEPIFVASKTRRAPLRRARRVLLAVFTAQYTLVAIGTGLAVAGVLHYVAVPEIVGKFEAISAALRR